MRAASIKRLSHRARSQSSHEHHDDPPLDFDSLEFHKPKTRKSRFSFLGLGRRRSNSQAKSEADDETRPLSFADLVEEGGLALGDSFDDLHDLHAPVHGQRAGGIVPPARTLSPVRPVPIIQRVGLDGTSRAGASEKHSVRHSLARPAAHSSRARSLGPEPRIAFSVPRGSCPRSASGKCTECAFASPDSKSPIFPVVLPYPPNDWPKENRVAPSTHLRSIVKSRTDHDGRAHHDGALDGGELTMHDLDSFRDIPVGSKIRITTSRTYRKGYNGDVKMEDRSYIDYQRIREHCEFFFSEIRPGRKGY